MRRPFKILISTAAMGLILVLMIPAMQKKQEETKGIKIDEVISISSLKELRGQLETKKAEDVQDIEEVSGLIVEKTMTKIGYEFYEHFFSLWEAPKGITGYNIYINEKASPMWGSLVYINVDNILVWNRMLKPRSNDIEEAAINSIGLVTTFLLQYEEIKRQLEEGGDMVGNGIW